VIHLLLALHPQPFAFPERRADFSVIHEQVILTLWVLHEKRLSVTLIADVVVSPAGQVVVVREQPEL
jgi:hypothetical protein